MKAAALAALVVALPGLAAEPVTRARYLMGTTCSVTAASGHDAALGEAKRIEEMLSTWTDSSELARLNACGADIPVCAACTDRNVCATQISPELCDVLQHARTWADRTGGAFNPLVRPLIDAWKTRDEGAVPANLTDALRRTRLANFTLDDCTATLANGARIEEGAFGKGYAIDRMLPLLEGDAAIDFGGQLGVRGEHEVSVADPLRRDCAVVVFTIEDASLSTSSGSEKTFVVGGKRFTHIIDPRTGEALPPRGSVSVVHARALDADILSTALYVMGVDEGLRWADANGVAALFITTDRKLRPSSRFRAHVRDVRVVDRKFSFED